MLLAVRIYYLKIGQLYKRNSFRFQNPTSSNFQIRKANYEAYGKKGNEN